MPQLDPVIIYSQVWGILTIAALFFAYNLVVSQSDSYESNRGAARVGRFLLPEHLVEVAFGLTILTTFSFPAASSLMGRS